MADWWTNAPVVDQAPSDAWWTVAPPAEPAPSQNVQPASRWQRFLTGAGDIFRGAEQFSARMREGEGEPAFIQRLRENPNTRGAVGDLRMETAPEVDQRLRQREADYRESMRLAGNDPGSTDWFRMGGQVVSAIPAAAAGPVPATLRGAAGIGAAQGAVMNALQPVTSQTADFWDEKTRQALFGAATGAAGGAAAYGAGRLLTGSQSASPQVRELHQAGVQMTPGQIAGGYARRIEDAAASIPVVGPQIRSAQREGVESFNRAVANNVLRPIRQNVDDAAQAGRGLVDDVYDRISAEYDRFLPRVRQFGPDADFYADLQQVGQQFLTPSARNEFQNFMRDNILSRTAGQQLDGRGWKEIDEVLGRFVHEYRGSLDPAQREMGQAAQGVQRAFRELLARTNPHEAQGIRGANEAFARFIRMERAAGAQGAADGVFSPSQFSNAVRMSDTSARRGQYARGDALMQDLSDAGRAVLPATVPDSGTPERLMLAQLLSGGGLGAATAAATGGVGAVPIAAGAAGSMAYTPAMRRFYQAMLLAQRPGAVQAAGNALVPTGAPVAVPLGAMMLSPPERPNQ